MPATKRLVLDLPADQVDEIEARVAAGEFDSASALVAADLDDIGFPVVLDDGSPEWLASGESCRETLRRIDAGVEPTCSADEVRAYLSEQRASRVARTT